MTRIQILLIAALATLVVVYLRRLRTRISDRLILLALGGSGIVLVANPELSTRLAHAVGVGRGADLVTYFGLVGLGFLWLALYAKLRELEERQTELAREVAIHHARDEPPS